MLFPFKDNLKYEDKYIQLPSSKHCQEGEHLMLEKLSFHPDLRIIILIAAAKGRHVSNYSRRSLVGHGNSIS
jgi:hypothetical protein